MARVKNNNEYRGKIKILSRDTLENDSFNPKRESYVQTLEQVKVDYPKYFDIAKTIVKRSYPEEHCNTLQYFKSLYGSPCDVVAKDSCYYFAFTDQENVDDEGKAIENEKHFDFKLNGDLDGSEHGRNNDFAYAYFRDEMKKKNLNPDINVEQEDNQNNPHLQKHTDANQEFLGLSNYSEDNINLARKFNDQFACDVIGTHHCRSRAIACTKDEFSEMNKFLMMKSKLVQTHQEWIREIREDIKDIQSALKKYRYLDEAIECANRTFEKLGIDVKLDESHIIKTDSTGLMIYSPENVSDRIAQRHKAKLTREEKIALFQKQQTQSSN